MIESVHARMDEAGKLLGADKQELEKLKKADHEHIFEVALDNGRTFKAYRVQHNNRRGPYKGGVRYHKDVSLDEVQSLATLMSLKTAAVGIPMGGGKGGVAVDPRNLSAAELEELSRKYARYLEPHIGPDTDIPAPDVNTNAVVIDWMVDEYEKLTGDKSKASFTGKSIKNGGSLGRDAATGRGGVLALMELLELEGKADQPLTYAVQGFGNVGSFFAAVAARLCPRWRLVAASDSEAAVYSRDGLDAAALQKFKEGKGRFKDYAESGAEIIDNDKLLALDVDVLVLAGFEDTVMAGNMKSVRAGIIVEMANGPVSGEAYEYLSGQGKTILPDIIANAGGVVVSYLEWLQNKQGEHWTVSEVNDKLATYMRHAVRDMFDYSQKYEVDLTAAAFAMALERLLGAR